MPSTDPASAQEPLVSSAGGAAAAAHPDAARAATEVLSGGGSAVDAAVAAHAVICVVMPEAAGLGGDVLALVGEPAGGVYAVNGTGLSPRGLSDAPPTTGGASVTVPGLVDGWLTLHRRWGRLSLAAVLEPARRLAAEGVAVEDQLADAVRRQHGRLLDGGAADWELLDAVASPGARWRQPALAELLTAVGERGRAAFYGGRAAQAIAAAVARCGGVLQEADLHGHRTACPPPVSVPWGSGRVSVQPPHSQGVLLAMALQAVERLLDDGVEVDDHVLVEATQAAFAHRSSCGRGAALLEERLEVDPHRASGRRGPRAYLHTAGVATVDAEGLVVSSLVSVFDDFGSGVFVPELGFVLNNRAAGFTDGENTWAPGKRPVHTLAPALVHDPGGAMAALATPGADGQVQTLLQVLAARRAGRSLPEAVAAPRWRSQDGDLLVEEGHAATADLAARGHRTRSVTPGDEVFGAVVAAGTAPDADPWALADWRRRTSSGAVA